MRKTERFNGLLSKSNPVDRQHDAARLFFWLRTFYMKWWFLAVVLGFISSEAVRNPAEAAAPQPQKPLWHTNYERAKEMARREGKPLFLVFR